MEMIYAIADVPHADYDNYDMLNTLFHALSPLGWKHSIDDTCPSLYKEERHGNTCRIFVEYVDPDKRENHHWSVLSYQCHDAEGCLTFHEGFDNVDKLIIYLTEKVTS